MIVTCESCETQFQLDDAKVPEGGIRVRCSRCKHAFFVESPRAPDQERAEVLAREALEQDVSGASSDFGLDDDESDWQFNEDVSADPSATDERNAVRDAVDDLLGDSVPPEPTPQREDDIGIDLSRDLREPEGFDLAGSDLDVPDLSAEVGPDANDESPAESPFADPGAEDLHALGDDASALEPPPSETGPVATEPPGLSGLDAFLADDDSASDLGLSEEWDLGEDEPASSGATPIGRITRTVPTDAGLAPNRRVPDESAFDIDSEVASEAAWIGRARAAFGWVCVSLLCAYSAVAGFWPSWSAHPIAFTSQPVAGFETEAIRGYWIENAAVGPIYIISGRLNAAPSQASRQGTQLRIRLLDEAGDVIAVQSAVVGPPIAEQLLRERQLSDLRALQEERALRMAWLPFADGESRPFQAILGDVPSTAVAFKFEAVSAARPPSREPEPAPAAVASPAGAGQAIAR